MGELSRSEPDNSSLPLFVPSLDGSVYFYGKDLVVQKLPLAAKDIVANSPFIGEDGSVFVGHKETRVLVVELDSGRLLDSFESTPRGPQQQVPLSVAGTHWPEGSVLLATSTYTIKGVHPRAPDRMWNVSLSEFTAIVPGLAEAEASAPPLGPARSHALVESMTGEVVCVDKADGRPLWTLPWSARVAAFYRVSLAGGTASVVREQPALLLDSSVSSRLRPAAVPVLIGQLGDLLFAAPYLSALSPPQPAQPAAPLMIASGAPSQAAPDAEPGRDCPANASASAVLLGLHLVHGPALPDPTPAAPDSAAVLPRVPPSLASTDPDSLPSSSSALLVLGGLALLLLPLPSMLAYRLALHTLSSPPLQTAVNADSGLTDDDPRTAKRKKKRQKGQPFEPRTHSEAEAEPSPEPAQAPAAAGGSAPPAGAGAPAGVEAALRRVGKIEVRTDRVLGYGSHGTVVYEGALDGRRVAVKRLLRALYELAAQEVALFLESDEHPHVVRYYAQEQDGDFIYLALTYCPRTLEQHVASLPAPPPARLPDGPDGPALLALLQQLVGGLGHLHALHIVHRDLKPANILLDARMAVRITDMGLARKVGPTDASVSAPDGAGAAGSLGWRAPELCGPGLPAADAATPPARRLRLSKKSDVFALGCVMHYVLTRGQHPFGQPFEREANILRNKLRLDVLRHWPEALDLVSAMLQHEPAHRPSVHEISRHPLFWDAERRLLFLRDASDWFEAEKPAAPAVLALEALAGAVLGPGLDWGGRVHAALADNLGKYRRYNHASIRDLLRVIRNKSHHYRDLPPDVQALLGSLPDGFVAYFLRLFRPLLIEVFAVVRAHCRDEPAFRSYF